jgi:hypothetical protein
MRPMDGGVQEKTKEQVSGQENPRAPTGGADHGGPRAIRESKLARGPI